MAMTIESLPGPVPEEGKEKQDPIQALLHFLRNALDDRKLFSTTESRTITIAEHCMLEEPETDDPIQILKPYLPNVEQFGDWYRPRARQIGQLTSQNKHDYMTDRYDIDQEIGVYYYNTSWLVRFREADQLMQGKKDIRQAGMALQLMIYEAHWQMIDDGKQKQELQRRQGEFIINGLINLVQ